MTVTPLQRRTLPMRRLLEALLAADGETHAYELGRHLEMSSGSLSPMLAKLEAAGTVESRWEDLDARAIGRPLRKFAERFKLMAKALQATAKALDPALPPEFRARPLPTLPQMDPRRAAALDAVRSRSAGPTAPRLDGRRR